MRKSALHCPETVQGSFKGCTTLGFLAVESDELHVRENRNTQPIPPAQLFPWALQMRAVASDEPERLVQNLTGAILACGGWMLSRGASDCGIVSLLFEFERQACLDIYSVLVGAGLELSQDGHAQMTELYQCTRMSGEDRSEEIVSIDLEIYSVHVRTEEELSFCQVA